MFSFRWHPSRLVRAWVALGLAIIGAVLVWAATERWRCQKILPALDGSLEGPRRMLSGRPSSPTRDLGRRPGRLSPPGHHCGGAIE
jgi:hypothetical protein